VGLTVVTFSITWITWLCALARPTVPTITATPHVPAGRPAGGILACGIIPNHPWVNYMDNFQ
jgi:hypothetical protein